MGAAIALTSRPIRGVFDTNVVVSALLFGGRLAWLRQAWAERRLAPVVCRETVSELLRVLAYPKFSLTGGERELLLADYLPYAETARLPHPWPELPIVCRDRDDRVFAALTLAAGAEFLVSGDGDLAALSGALPVVSPRELRARVPGPT